MPEIEFKGTRNAPSFEPRAFGPGAQVVYPGAAAPSQIEQIQRRDPVTGETRTVEKITYNVDYNAICEQPQVFGTGAAVLLGDNFMIGNLIKNLDQEHQFAILSGTSNHGQNMAATGSAANVPPQAPANATNSSQTTNSFDPSSIGVDQTMRSGDQIYSSARDGPLPSHVGSTPWTESQFVPHPLQAPEDHQGGMEHPPMAAESVGNDVASQEELDEEERKLQEMFEALEKKKAARLMAVQQGKAKQTTVTALANSLQSLAPPPYSPPATSASTASTTGDRKAVPRLAEHSLPPVVRPGVV